METADLLKAALEAVRAAGVPKELQATALELAVTDLRASRGPSKTNNRGVGRPVPPAGAGSKARGKRPGTRKPAPQEPDNSVLSSIPEESVFFKAIEKETGVSPADLADIFHIEGGSLEIKLPSKSLGANKRAQTQTLTALLAGAVIAGTQERKLSFGEINRVCNAKHCFDSANAASSIKATPGFSSVGSAKTQAVVTRNGWQDAFAGATRRVLGKPEPTT